MTDTQSEQQLLAAKLALVESRYREALDLLDRIPARGADEEAQKLVLVGQGLEGLNQVAAADEAYSRAQALAPGFAAPILREGVLRYRRGDREGARILLHRYVDREPGNPEAFYFLSLCELDPMRRAAFIRRVVVLDDRRGTWSTLLTGT